MKPNLLNLTAFLLILAGIVTSCKDKVTDEKESIYPIDVPFEEYSLEGSGCEWIEIHNKPYFPYYSDLLMINSNKELEKYIKCSEGESYPAINFSTQTLLIAYGVQGHFVIPNYRTLQQLSKQNYEMLVNLEPYANSVITEWQDAIIVNKILDGTHIELIITKEIEL